MFGLALNMPSIIGRAKLLLMVLLAKYEGFFGELFYRYFPEEVQQNYFGCHLELVIGSHSRILSTHYSPVLLFYTP